MRRICGRPIQRPFRPPLRTSDTSSSFSFPWSTSFSHSLRICLSFSFNSLRFSLTSLSSFTASCCMPDTRSKMSVCRWRGGVIKEEKEIKKKHKRGKENNENGCCEEPPAPLPRGLLKQARPGSASPRKPARAEVGGLVRYSQTAWTSGRTSPERRRRTGPSPQRSSGSGWPSGLEAEQRSAGCSPPGPPPLLT